MEKVQGNVMDMKRNCARTATNLGRKNSAKIVMVNAGLKE